MPAWPGDLPRQPMDGSYTFGAADNVVRTPNDVGQPITRRRFTGSTRFEGGTLALTEAQARSLMDFWDINCAQGSLEFTMPAWRDGVVRDHMFTAPPQFSRSANTYFAAISLQYTTTS